MPLVWCSSPVLCEKHPSIYLFTFQTHSRYHYFASFPRSPRKGKFIETRESSSISEDFMNKIAQKWWFLTGFCSFGMLILLMQHGKRFVLYFHKQLINSLLRWYSHVPVPDVPIVPINFVDVPFFLIIYLTN